MIGSAGGSPDLKPVKEQVVVITGASSGIGLTTARMAADRGARLVLAARSEDELRELVEEIRREGGDAAYVAADVTDRDDVRRIAETAVETYGGFDTWINAAGEFVYGRLQEVPDEDKRRVFETNVWGLLYGSLEAADHLKREGGAILNVGSVVSDRALVLQGTYSASKHAVKGFTDALRMELEEEGAPVSVTLVKPSAIDTPYPEHATNHMDAAARLPPPLYAPETVARAILRAAETPERDVYVGFGGKSMQLLGRYAPSLMDALMETVFYRFQRKDEPPRPDAGSITEEPVGDLEERGDYDGPVIERSAYTRAVQGRNLTGALLGGVGLAVAVAYARYRSARRRGE